MEEPNQNEGEQHEGPQEDAFQFPQGNLQWVPPVDVDVDAMFELQQHSNAQQGWFNLQMVDEQNFLGDQQMADEQNFLGDQQMVDDQNFLGDQQMVDEQNLLVNQQMVELQNLLDNQQGWGDQQMVDAGQLQPEEDQVDVFVQWLMDLSDNDEQQGQPLMANNNQQLVLFRKGTIRNMMKKVLRGTGMVISGGTIEYLQDHMSMMFTRLVNGASDVTCKSGKRKIQIDHLRAAVKEDTSVIFRRNMNHAIYAFMFYMLHQRNTDESRRFMVDEVLESIAMVLDLEEGEVEMIVETMRWQVLNIRSMDANRGWVEMPKHLPAGWVPLPLCRWRPLSLSLSLSHCNNRETQRGVEDTNIGGYV